MHTSASRLQTSKLPSWLPEQITTQHCSSWNFIYKAFRTMRSGECSCKGSTVRSVTCRCHLSHSYLLLMPVVYICEHAGTWLNSLQRRARRNGGRVALNTGHGPSDQRLCREKEESAEYMSKDTMQIQLWQLQNKLQCGSTLWEVQQLLSGLACGAHFLVSECSVVPLHAHYRGLLKQR